MLYLFSHHYYRAAFTWRQQAALRAQTHAMLLCRNITSVMRSSWCLLIEDAKQPPPSLTAVRFSAQCGRFARSAAIAPYLLQKNGIVSRRGAIAPYQRHNAAVSQSLPSRISHKATQPRRQPLLANAGWAHKNNGQVPPIPARLDDTTTRNIYQFKAAVIASVRATNIRRRYFSTIFVPDLLWIIIYSSIFNAAPPHCLCLFIAGLFGETS